MTRCLTYRLLGVTPAALLLAFALAAFLYWLLPQSRATHHWSFPGILYIVGFVNQNRELLVMQHRHDGYSRYTLDLHSGKSTPFTEPDTSKLDLAQSLPLPFSLFAKSTETNTVSRLELRDERSNRVMSLPTNLSMLNLSQGTFSVYSGQYMQSTSLSTAGYSAISPNEQWLLISCHQPTPFSKIAAWIKNKTGWNLPDPAKTIVHHAILFNLHTTEQTRFELPTRNIPCFEMHPDNLGFAVTDLHNTSVNNVPPDLTSTITWYTLPPASPQHSPYQWLAILSTFLLPLLISKYRCKRRLI